MYIKCWKSAHTGETHMQVPTCMHTPSAMHWAADAAAEQCAGIRCKACHVSCPPGWTVGRVRGGRGDDDGSHIRGDAHDTKHAPSCSPPPYLVVSGQVFAHQPPREARGSPYHDLVGPNCSLGGHPRRVCRTDVRFGCVWFASLMGGSTGRVPACMCWDVADFQRDGCARASTAHTHGLACCSSKAKPHILMAIASRAPPGADSYRPPTINGNQPPPTAKARTASCSPPPPSVP